MYIKTQVCEMEIINEVLKIKRVLLEGEQESDSVLLDSLSRLQFVDLSYLTLKTTMIWKTVCALGKHGRTMQIRLLARALVKKWRRVIDVAIADGTVKKVYQEEPTIKKQLASTQIQEIQKKPLIRKNQQSLNDEKKQPKKENGLLEKPKKAFIQNKDRAIQHMRNAPNDIGSKPKIIVIQKKTLVQQDKRKAPDKIGSDQNIRKALIQKRSLAQKDMRKAPNELGHKEKVNKALVQKKPFAQVGTKKALHEIGPHQMSNKAFIQKKAPVQENKRKAPIEMNSQPKTKKPFLQEDRNKTRYEIEYRQELNKALLIQIKPFLQEDKLKCVDDATRLEAARKRLQENYEQAENAKRQRRIQVVELRNLPEKVLRQTKPLMERKGVLPKRSWDSDKCRVFGFS